MADPTSTADGVPGPSSTKPYLIRAIYEWCTDNGYTPYVAVLVDERTQVPREHIKDGEIVLNVSPMATSRLKFGNEWLEFSARFGGAARELWVPIDRIAAIYAKETGHGMGFEVESLKAEHQPLPDQAMPVKPALAVAGEALQREPAAPAAVPAIATTSTPPAIPDSPKRPKLTVVK